jgi:hypothetical protein
MSDQRDEIPLTYRSGPSDPVRLADEPGTWAEVFIAHAPEQVWPAVTDIELPARFSDEFLGATWEGDGLALGASFLGRNRHLAIGEWEVVSFVDVLDDGRSFGWATIDRDQPGSRWRFDLAPDGTGTRLRYSLSLGPGPSGITMAIESMPEKEPRIIRHRLREHHGNMVATLAGIKALVEARA